MSEGQISETSMMTPDQGAESTPGTDDGVPPADATQHEPHGMPRNYSEEPGERSGLSGDADDLGGAS